MLIYCVAEMMDDTDEVKCEGLLTFVLGICKFPTRKRAILNRLKIIQKKKDNVCCLIIMLYCVYEKSLLHARGIRFIGGKRSTIFVCSASHSILIC